MKNNFEMVEEYNGRKMKKSEINQFFDDIFLGYDKEIYTDIRNLIISLLDDNSDIKISVDSHRNFSFLQDDYKNKYGHLFICFERQSMTFSSCSDLSIRYSVPLSSLDDPAKYDKQANVRLGSFNSTIDMYFYDSELRSFNCIVQPHTSFDSKYYCEGGKFGGIISSKKTYGPEKWEYVAKMDDFIGLIPEIIKGSLKPELPITYESTYFENLLMKYDAKLNKSNTGKSK